MVYYYNHPVKVLTKIFLALFWPFFDQNLSILTKKIKFWPISLNLFIGFHYFCIFILYVWSITIITLLKFWQQYFWPFFYPFLTKICPFWPKYWHFGQFLPITSKDFANFAYSNYFYGLLLELSSESFDKKNFTRFWPFFYPNLSVLTPKKCNFGPFLTLSS